MSSVICIYDNNTGIEIPTKIGTYSVNVVLGDTIKNVHKSAGECMMFGVFTHIPDSDFVVPTEYDKKLLSDVFGFGNKDYKISVRESSMWYHDKAEKNIIISDSVKMNDRDLSIVLMTYLNNIIYQKKKEEKIKKIDMYTIMNIRNSKVIMKTPIFDDAINICNKTPCSVVININNEIVYRTKFGKISIPFTISKYKSSHPDTNGVFNFKQK